MRKTCANGHVFRQGEWPTCPTCERERMAMSPLPAIGAPATRALQAAAVDRLVDLAVWSERDLLALHGMGPRAVDRLREHLATVGMSFAP